MTHYDFPKKFRECMHPRDRRYGKGARDANSLLAAADVRWLS